MKKILSRLTKGPLTALFVAAVFAMTFTLAACEDGGGEIKKKDEVSGAGELFGEVTTEPTPAPATAVTPEQLMASNEQLISQLSATIEALRLQIAANQKAIDDAKISAEEKEKVKKENELIEAKMEELGKWKEKLEKANEDLDAAYVAVDKSNIAVLPPEVVGGGGIEDIEVTFKTATDGDSGGANPNIIMSFCTDAGFTSCKPAFFPEQKTDFSEGDVGKFVNSKDAFIPLDGSFSEANFNYMKLCNNVDSSWLLGGIDVRAKVNGKWKQEYFNFGTTRWLNHDHSCALFSKNDMGIYIKYNVSNELGSESDDNLYLCFDLKDATAPATTTDPATVDAIKELNARWQGENVSYSLDSIGESSVLCMYLNSDWHDQESDGDVEAYGGYIYNADILAENPKAYLYNTSGTADDDHFTAKYVDAYLYKPGDASFLNKLECKHYAGENIDVSANDTYFTEIPSVADCKNIRFVASDPNDTDGDVLKNTFDSGMFPNETASTAEETATSDADNAKKQTFLQLEAQKDTAKTNLDAAYGTEAPTKKVIFDVQGKIDACDSDYKSSSDACFLDVKKEWDMRSLDAQILDTKREIEVTETVVEYLNCLIALNELNEVKMDQAINKVLEHKNAAVELQLAAEKLLQDPLTNTQCQCKPSQEAEETAPPAGEGGVAPAPPQ